MQSLHKPPSERSAWPAPEEDKESREMQEMQIRTFMEEHCQNDELKDIDIHNMCAAFTVALLSHHKMCPPCNGHQMSHLACRLSLMPFFLPLHTWHAESKFFEQGQAALRFRGQVWKSICLIRVKTGKTQGEGEGTLQPRTGRVWASRSMTGNPSDPY
eukprot:1157021-Pelagomonas_calceolata.AAC.6